MQRLDPRLWERTPRDADFLELRVGLGPRRAVYTLDGLRDPDGADDDLASELQRTVEPFTQLAESPLTLALPSMGVVGIAAHDTVLSASARALLVQLATHHAPQDVRVAVVFPDQRTSDWEWVRWLPHVWDDERAHRQLAATPDAARRVLSDLGELLQRRLQQDRSERHSPAWVIVVADAALSQDGSASQLPALLQRLRVDGPGVGIYSMYFGDRSTLPQECAATVDAMGTNPLLRIHRQTAGDEVVPVTLDQVGVSAADAFARASAPIRVSQSAGSASSEIPRRVSLLELFGGAPLEQAKLLEGWEREAEPFTTLAVPIGQRAGGEPLLFDLHDVTESQPAAGGPNALVAGTVGSGKSELLLSLVASLSARFHPHDVVFAILDFKGGATSDALRDLPHVVSTLTDLELDEVPRALASLKAELGRREQLFRDASTRLGTTVNHIDMYLQARRQGFVQEPLPYLVLIVDEFVVLKQALPEQMDKFVNIAVKGRALGIRMLVAAQKPAGAIGDQIRANTRSRICLRVAQPEDSQEMIGRNDAASLTGVGRAYLRIGEDEVFDLFQTAWSGAPMTAAEDNRDAAPVIVEVALDGRRRARQPAGSTRPAGAPARTQLQGVIETISAAAATRGIERLPGPWLPLLPESIELTDVRAPDGGGWDGVRWQPAAHWLAPVVGLVDDPLRQAQQPLTLPLGTDGNTAIFGAPGSGKTTLLRTVLSSLALDHSPAEVQCYVWDSSGALKDLEVLPHVGGVVGTSEPERVERWWWVVRDQLARRGSEPGRTGAASKPAIVVAIDNYTALAAAHEQMAEDLIGFAQQCAGAGVYLVVASSGPLPYRLLSSFPLRVALELVDAAEYPDIVGDTRVDADTSARLVPKRGVRGRGLVAHPPREFQTARAMRLDGEAMARAAAERAAPVRVAPEHLPLRAVLDLDGASGSSTVLGLQTDSLQPLRIDLDDGPHFVVTGPHRAGKSTALQTWLLALAAHLSPEEVRVVLMDFGLGAELSPLRDLPQAVHVDDPDRAQEVVEQIDQVLAERRRDGRHGDTARIVVVIDDVDQFDAAAPQASGLLDAVLRRQRGLGCHLIISGLATDVAGSYGGLIGLARAGQSGLVLGCGDDGGSLNLRLPRASMERALPPGRGYFVRRGYPARPIQVAAAAFDEGELEGWVARIRGRWLPHEPPAPTTACAPAEARD
ncbi:MAG TPA: FtsK/SpoIIIE domain-containing protein [Chloroflexota bacterium]